MSDAKVKPAPWTVKSEFGNKRFDEYTGEPKAAIDYHWIKARDGDNVTLFASGLHSADDAALAARICKCVNMHEDLVAALDRAYLDIVTFLNEGDFKRKVVWDAGYIVDALAKAKGDNQ